MPRVDERNGSTIRWLLDSDEPAVRFLARRDLLARDARADERRILDGPWVTALLAGQRPDGTFGVHAYAKWAGAHWRLVSLVELAVPAGEPAIVRSAETVLDWLAGPAHRSNVPTIDGLVRRCASQEGNALAVCSRLGMADDPRVRLLAESLVEWQWPDGGWNCDRRPQARHSSFNESLAPAWGLWEYGMASRDATARKAAQRAGELFLEHRIFRSHRTGQVMDPAMVVLHYPPYWHYDFLQALLVLSRMDRLPDPRADDALELLERRRRKDGRWQAGAYWWRALDAKTGSPDVVDWGRSRPNEMLTLNALRVLRAAGRAS